MLEKSTSTLIGDLHIRQPLQYIVVSLSAPTEPLGLCCSIMSKSQDPGSPVQFAANESRLSEQPPSPDCVTFDHPSIRQAPMFSSNRWLITAGVRSAIDRPIDVWRSILWRERRNVLTYGAVPSTGTREKGIDVLAAEDRGVLLVGLLAGH